MPTREVPVQRVSVISSKPFDEVVRELTATIGRPDMKAFRSALAAAATLADLEEVVKEAIGSSELMEFARFDAARDETAPGPGSSGCSSGIRSS
jgi:hypothetical protein